MKVNEEDEAKAAELERAELEQTRRRGRERVFERIRAEQPISRAELARALGMRPSTVSTLVEGLKADGWVTEGGAVARPRGRRPTMLTLNDRVAVLVADVHPRHAVVAVLDLPGRLLARRVIPLASQPLRAIQSIAESMKAMQEQHGGLVYAGIGVSLPGRIDPATQHLMFAPNLCRVSGDWARLDIRAAFEERMGLAVELENDANGCLLSEMWYGRIGGVRDAVLVAIEEGIGTALLTNGEVVRGRAGMAGEFGHIQLDPAGPECGCGQRGCWEMYASTMAAQRYYAELRPGLVAVGADELLHLAEEGDAAAVAALLRQGEAIGRGLRLLVAALSPEVIVLTGQITSLWGLVGDAVEAAMGEHRLAAVQPRIVAAADAESARLRGAAVVLLRRLGQGAVVG